MIGKLWARKPESNVEYNLKPRAGESLEVDSKFGDEEICLSGIKSKYGPGRSKSGHQQRKKTFWRKKKDLCPAKIGSGMVSC